ncbi:MAG: glycoside hydrolase family 38 C-terminal domain-containing protein, partial [Bacteroidota bacterium]
TNELKENNSQSSNSEEFENNYYKLKIDPDKGTITSLFDKELEKELIDGDSGYKLGEFIYEQLENRHSMERLTNSNKDTVYIPLKKQITTLSNIEVSKIEDGDIWKSIKIHGRMPICADNRGVNIEIRLYNKDKRIELLYDMHKLQVTDPEAVYVAFPFKMKGKNQLAFEAQGGTVYPGVNQLEGTSSDWNWIQNFSAVKNDNGQIVFCSNDVPLVQFGDINTGRFYYKHIPEQPHIYSWVLNNYWTTNFKASQEGEMKWHYYITSSSDNSNTFATRFGWGSRIPLLTRVMPAGKSEMKSISKSVVDIDVPNLLLVNARLSLDGKGIILHLRETEGDHAILDVNKLKQETGAVTISEVSILEEELKELNQPLLFEHYETKLIKLVK